MDDRDKTFLALKRKLRAYAKKLAVLTDDPHHFELCGERAFEVTSLKSGKTVKKKNAYFAGIVQQRTYVGFYFMPPYTERGFMEDFSNAMKRRLRGKSCFHFRTAGEVTSEVDRLLRKGFKLFKDKGMI